MAQKKKTKKAVKAAASARPAARKKSAAKKSPPKKQAKKLIPKRAKKKAAAAPPTTRKLIVNQPMAMALDPSTAAPDVLGPIQASSIVTGCAFNEQDTSKKLSDIPALNTVIFQACVKKGVLDAGYQPGGIPASPNTTLDQVIQAIEDCPAKED
jgi:hypothetical protein